MLRRSLVIGPAIALVSLGIALLAVDGGRGEQAAAQVAPTSTRTPTVTPNSASIALTASPAEIVCDGVNSTTVTAKVTDAQNDNVIDGTPIAFFAESLGTTDPQDTHTINGEASSNVTPFPEAATAGGMTVVVMSGLAQASIRIDCISTPSTPSPTTVPMPTATIARAVAPPKTGDGSATHRDPAAFALAAGAFVVGTATLVLAARRKR